MRVLVVAASPPWPMTDGSSLVLNHQLRHLSGRHGITVLAAGRPAGAPAPRPEAVGLDDDLTIRWFGPTGRRAIGYARRRLAGFVEREPVEVFAVEVPELLSAFDDEVRHADVVHLHGWGTARFASRSPVPTVHAPIDAWQRGHGEQRALPGWRRVAEAGERRKVVLHERRHYPRCDAVVVVAPADAEVLRDAVPDARVEVIPNGVEAGAPPPSPTDEPVLGFHGVLSTVANETAALALVDDVLPRVRAADPRARALVIGKDPGRVLLDRRSDWVEVTGAVDDVRAALARVAVYVAPIERGSGIKNKVLEAMAAGLPVVATPRAVDGIAREDGIVVAEGPTDLAAAAARLLGDRDERRRLGSRNRACAEGATWTANAAALEALWQDVTAGAGR